MKLLFCLLLLGYSISLDAQKYLNDPRLFEEGERKKYTGENLTNIQFPLGGLGGGTIIMNGQAERNIWQIFNNFTQATMPESFFAIQTSIGDQIPITRQLQTTNGQFQAIDSLTFEGEFPFGWYHFYDETIPVDVDMEVFSPFIPLDAKNSALPCAIFNIKATNNTSSSIEVNLLATQKNPIGYNGSLIYSPEISQFPEEGIMLEDFEAGNFNNWTKTGNAYNHTPNTDGMENISGKYFAKSSKAGKGNLALDPFTITKRYLHFKINGGRDVAGQYKIGLALLINNELVKFASGSDQDDLYHDYFDLKDYQGQTAILVLVDNRTDSYIGIDDIFLSDELLNPNGIIYESFEDELSLSDWSKTGNAFNNLPSSGEVGLQELRGFRDNGLVNTFDDGNNGSDSLIGELTSPEFTIGHSHIYFLLGGGEKENTSINLLLNGEIVRSTSGNERDIMSWKFWNVSHLQGEIVQIQIKDQNTSPWGHIVIDNIVFSDQSLPIRDLNGVGGNVNSISEYQGTTFLHMTAENNPADMVLLSTTSKSNGSADIGNMAGFVNSFSLDGTLPEIDSTTPSDVQSSYTGAISSAKTLAPGESHEVTFVLTWSFPENIHGIGAWSHAGNKYNTWWSNAKLMAEYIVDNLDELSNKTKTYHSAIYESNLPHYVLDRITSQTAILKAQTTFWAADGVYGNWEGISGDVPLGQGSVNHVSHYAQAHARLFPEIARIRRNTSFSYQYNDGGLPYRHPDNIVVFDGQCGEILSSYREHLLSENNQWLNTNWPNIKKAMDYVINRWDGDKDGLLSGPQWMTLDANVGGTSSWMGTLYLAALKASAEMAQIENDVTSQTSYEQIYSNGTTAQDELLWNGEYFIQVNEDQAERDYLTGSAIDQLLGEFWSNQLGFTSSIYDKDRTKKALQSVYKYNFKDDMQNHTQEPRKFLEDNDGGLIMITWPLGGRPKVYPYYAAEIMTGFEYPAIATMINHGLLDEGFSALLAISDRYNGRIRTGLDQTIWGFSGNPFGDDEWGKWYFRAMSSYGILLASQGFIYDGPKEKIGFLPKWKPEDHRSFFSAAKGWGVFSQKYLSDGMEAKVDIRYGQVTIKTIVLEISNLDQDDIEVKVNETLDVPFEINENIITITLDQTISVQEGQSLDILITTRKIVGIDKANERNNALTIYPNPATDQFTIRFDEEFNNGVFSIFSSIGQLIDQRKLDHSSKFKYSIKNLPIGSYLLKLQSKNGKILYGQFIVN